MVVRDMKINQTHKSKAKTKLNISARKTACGQQYTVYIGTFPQIESCQIFSN